MNGINRQVGTDTDLQFTLALVRICILKGLAVCDGCLGDINHSCNFMLSIQKQVLQWQVKVIHCNFFLKDLTISIPNFKVECRKFFVPQWSMREGGKDTDGFDKVKGSEEGTADTDGSDEVKGLPEGKALCKTEGTLETVGNPLGATDREGGDKDDGETIGPLETVGAGFLALEGKEVASGANISAYCLVV
eukprot:9014544-Ditylum_brightwellii.AAC.1